MNFDNLNDKVNSISNRTRLIIGLCIIAAGLLFGVWNFDLIGDKADKEAPQSAPAAETTPETEAEREAKVREARKKFFDTSDLKRQYEGYK
jgi:hypothetical protein